MSAPDLNLLITLDVLLREGSVARAAQILRLSPSAMSRALARLRETTGDPLLVRAGRGLVPTPRALELRERVSTLVQEAEAALRPAEILDPASCSAPLPCATPTVLLKPSPPPFSRASPRSTRRAPALCAEGRQGQHPST